MVTSSVTGPRRQVLATRRPPADPAPPAVGRGRRSESGRGHRRDADALEHTEHLRREPGAARRLYGLPAAVHDAAPASVGAVCLLPSMAWPQHWADVVGRCVAGRGGRATGAEVELDGAGDRAADAVVGVGAGPLVPRWELTERRDRAAGAEVERGTGCLMPSRSRSRGRWCDLSSARAAVLEHNVSPEAAARYKHAAQVSELGGLLRKRLPELSEPADTGPAALTIMVAGRCGPTRSRPPPGAPFTKANRAGPVADGLHLRAARNT
ncbi:MAG TPA: hypothetical protein VGH57_23585 [Amycolatopsis sp.]